MNLAALYNTPTIFFVENNLYAVSTHISEQTRETRLSARGLSLGVPAIEFDGMDVIAARLAMQKAREMIHNDKGPVLLEAQTYRYYHQSGAVKGSAFGYREKEEETLWHERDPVVCFADELKGAGVINDKEIAHLMQRATTMIDKALDQLLENYRSEERRVGKECRGRWLACNGRERTE